MRKNGPENGPELCARIVRSYLGDPGRKNGPENGPELCARIVRSYLGSPGRKNGPENGPKLCARIVRSYLGHVVGPDRPWHNDNYFVAQINSFEPVPNVILTLIDTSRYSSWETQVDISALNNAMWILR